MSSVSAVLVERGHRTETPRKESPQYDLEKAEARAVAALASCGYRVVALGAKVEIIGHKLVLSGSMPTFYFVSVAQETVKRAIGNVPALYKLVAD